MGKWDDAADSIRTTRAQAELDREEAESRRQADAAIEAAAQEKAYRAHLAAVKAGTSVLEAFLREHGASAQRLLAAFGEQADGKIFFGRHSEGGGFYAIWFTEHGLVAAIGDSRSEPRFNPVSAEEAVTYFIRTFPQKDPREIGKWLEEQLDRRAGY